MNDIVAMFPGQGSQYLGMGSELINQFNEAKQVFEEADDTLGFSLSKLCFSGPDSELAITTNTQPAILTTSIAYWRVLEAKGMQANYFAGHSLGEYSALVASKRMDFSDALTLVRKRGQAMQEAVPVGLGAMAAVLRASTEIIQETISEVIQNNASNKVVEIANFNSPQQIVIAGHSELVQQVVEALTIKKFKAVLLNVSAPFHSSLMSPAKEQMRPLVDEVSLSFQETTIVPNVSAEPIKKYEKNMLLKQIDQPVLWTQTLLKLAELGAKNFVEVGPGKVLSGLSKRTLGKETPIFQTEKINDLLNVLL